MALCGHSEDPHLTRIPEAQERLSVDHWCPLSHCSWHQYLLAIIEFSGKKIHSKKNRKKSNLDTQKTPKGTRQAKLNL